MDGTRARILQTRIDTAPRIARRSVADAHAGRLPAAWAAVLGIGWPVALVVGALLEPAPADAQAGRGVATQLVVLTVWTLLAGTVVTAARRLPAAARWAGLLGVGMLGLAVACPVTGHHAVGGWWFGQLAITAAMLGAAFAAARAGRRG